MGATTGNVGSLGSGSRGVIICCGRAGCGVTGGEGASAGWGTGAGCGITGGDNIGETGARAGKGDVYPPPGGIGKGWSAGLAAAYA